MNKRIYLDHAATTDMLPEVSYAMEPYFVKKFGNASTAYELGEEAKQAIEIARKEIAMCIDAKPQEIFFTSGGSESDNWAVKSIAGYRKHIGNHILTSKIEHHAILHSCEYLEKLDYKVTYLDVDKNGIVDMRQMKKLVEKGIEDTQKEDRVTLISIMYGNNEIGTIEPIEEICHLANQYDVYVHTDAVQAVGQIPISVKRSPIDMLSASAHKFHGPKGVGFLYVREGLEIPSFIHGGSQEKGKRAGTENVAGIIGMAKALTIANRQMGKQRRELTHLRDYFAKRIMREIPNVVYNGHPTKRLPGNLNFSFRDINGTALLVLLEEEGILASAGSACTTGTTRSSHVIEAIGVPKEYAYGTLRFSMGRQTSKKDVDKTIEVLKNAVKLLRGGI